MPHTDGLLALEHFLKRRSVEVKPSTACLLDLASIVLANIFFRFQDDFYLQLKGTAMSRKMAPNYVCLYMGVFENDFILNESNPFFPKILLYKQYDDVFMITKATPVELVAFLNDLNSRTEHVNFTMECDTASISFLDVRVNICDGKLQTDLY